MAKSPIEQAASNDHKQMKKAGKKFGIGKKTAKRSKKGRTSRK